MRQTVKKLELRRNGTKGQKEWPSRAATYCHVRKLGGDLKGRGFFEPSEIVLYTRWVIGSVESLTRTLPEENALTTWLLTARVKH